MQVIYNSLDMSDYNQVMLWALVAWVSLVSRVLENLQSTVLSIPSFTLSHTTYRLILWWTPKSIKVFVKCSKTDPFRQGYFIYMGKNSSSMCPVKAIVRYVHFASKEERLRITNDVNNKDVLYYHNNNVQQTYSREPEVL